MPIADLQGQLREFAAERDWEQFHSPKNLVMALTGTRTIADIDKDRLVPSR